MDGEFLEIHRGKFELDPCGNRGQPSIWCITHGVFFFRVGKDALNGLRTQRVGFSCQCRRMSHVLRSFYVVVPDMPRHGLCTLLIFGAAFADGTVFANVTFALVLPVAIAIGGGITQNLVLRTENAIVIFIVDIFIPRAGFLSSSSGVYKAATGFSRCRRSVCRSRAFCSPRRL